MSDLHTEPNRQALRSIEALQQALLDLVVVKPYRKITITELAEKSGLTRSTFYAHFETKDDLMDSLLDKILDEFYLWNKDYNPADPSTDRILESDIQFFKIWQEHREVIPLLEAVDFSCMLVTRMKGFWSRLYLGNIQGALPPIREPYSDYTINFLAVSFTGFLIEWIRQGMQPSAEKMGALLHHFAGPPALLSAREKFKDNFLAD